MKRYGKRDYSTKIIGVIGADHHVGTTHLVIMLANYLSSKEQYKTAVIDRSKGRSISVLQSIYECGEGGSSGMCHNNRFRMHNVDYYCMMEEKDIVDIVHQGYNYLIFDLGKTGSQNWHYELMCHMKILVGSCCEWQQESLVAAMTNDQLLCRKGRWAYAAFLGVDAVRKKIEKEQRIQIHKIPFEEDPFQLHRSHFEPLKNMLQEGFGCL